MKNRYYFIFFLLILGFLFRLLLIKLFPQPFGGDQDEYHRIAVEISRVGLYTHSYRVYGYPLLLAILYRLLGVNHQAVETMQAIVDTSTALFIFLIARKVFKAKNISWVAYVLYLFNPFTSAYVGVFLSEITAIFAIALIFLLFLSFIEKRNIGLIIALGIILGFFPQVRPAYLFFSLFVLFCLIFTIIKSVWKKSKKTTASVLLISLFSLPFFYNIVGNYKLYHQFSPLSVDNLFVREFYISLFIDSSERIAFIPKEVNWIYQEYSLPKETRQEYQAMRDKYFKLAIAKVKENPMGFIISRVKKMWFVWEKHSLFPYSGPNNRFINSMVYWGNVAILSFAVLGISLYVKQEVVSASQVTKKWLAALTILLFGYTSFLHSFTITAERFSLPSYPLIFLFAGYFLWSKLKGKIMNNE